jgi:PAS domain S-box-containing protein
MRRKLNLGFLAITLLLWAICVHTLLSSKGMQGLLNDLKEDIVPGAIAMTRIEYEAVEIRNWTFTYAMRGNVVRDGKTIKEWLQQRWADLEKDAREHLERGCQIVEGEPQAAQVIVDLSQKLVTASAEVIDLKDQGAGEDELLEKIRGEFGPVFYPLRETLNEHASAHLNELSAVETRVHDKHNTNIRYVITLGFGVTLLALLVALLVDRYFVTYITERKKAEEELRKREEQYHGIFDSATDGLLIFDREGRITEANPTACRMYGYAHAELTALSGKDIVHPDYYYLFEDFKHQVRVTGQFHAESVDVRKDGSTFDIDVRGTTFKLNGKPHLLAIIRDITERKRAVKALRDSEEKFKNLAENSPNMIFINKDGKVVYANWRCTEVMGYSTEEFYSPGFDFMTLIAPPSRNIVQASFAKHKDTKEVAPYECSLITKEGRTVEAMITTKLIDYEGGQAILGTITDITEHKQAEEALRESEQRFRDIAGNAMEWIWEVDADGKYTYASSVVEKILGYKSEEVLGKHFYDLFHPEDREELKKAAFEAFANKQPFREFINRNMHKNGNTVWLLTSGVPILDDEENLLGYRGADINVTERKLAEEALQSERDRLQSLMDGFTSAGIGIDVVRDNYEILYQNKALTGKFGYCVGKLCYETYMGREKPCEPCPMLTAIASGKPEGIELTGVDGRRYELLLIPIPNPDGPIDEVVEVVRDITERERAEEAIRESEERYRMLFQSANDAIFLMDGEYFINCNKMTLKMFGCTKEQIVGQPPYHFSPPKQPDGRDSKEKAMGKITAVLDGQPQFFEWQHCRYDGTLFDAEVSLKRLELSGRYYTLAIVRDITEHKRAEETLRRSEERYRRVADAVTDYIYTVRVENGQPVGTIHSQACEAVTGYSPEEFSSDSYLWIRMIPEEDRDIVRDQASRILLNDDPEPIEHHIVCKDGCIRWVSSTLVANRDAQGDLVSYDGLVCDITERKRAEEALKKSEEKFRKQFEEALDAIIIADAKTGIIIDCNPAASELVGREKTELVGKHQKILHPPEEIEGELSRTFKKHLGQKEGQALETQIITKGGEIKEVAIKASLLVIEGREVLQGVFRDITERKRAEQELKRLSAAVTQSANMIVIADPKGVIEYVNPQFSRLTGYSPAEAVGKLTSILKSGKQDREFYKNLWQTITSGKTWTGRLQNRRKDGTLYWERKSIAPIFDLENHIVNFLSVGEDITNEITAQQSLAEADKMSAVGMLAAGVAHEFKNYLAGIIGNASFALTELEEEGGLRVASETLTKIVDLGERANDVAMLLLSYSKAKPEELNQESLKKIIKNAVRLVDKEMKNLSIEVIVYSEEVPEVEISASKIQQLLLNLLINAQHAIKSDGAITIALLAEGDHVAVKVGDTGVGIPPENLSKIFDPFFSTKGVWGKDELVGTGMGLAICRNIAYEYGGDLTVESLVGVGTTFTLTLPVPRGNTAAPVQLLKKDRESKVLVFTLDKSIVSHYFKQACEANASMILIDDITKLPGDLEHVIDLVICDAKFTGKVELYKMVEICRRLKLPYMMVNCGTMEYQLADLYENSVANFKQLPDFSQLISSVVTHRPSEVSS